MSNVSGLPIVVCNDSMPGVMASLEDSAKATFIGIFGLVMVIVIGVITLEFTPSRSKADR